MFNIKGAKNFHIKDTDDQRQITTTFTIDWVIFYKDH